MKRPGFIRARLADLIGALATFAAPLAVYLFPWGV
jgi:hypothetical protein